MHLDNLKDLKKNGLINLSWIQPIPGLIRTVVYDSDSFAYVVIYKEKSREYTVRKFEIESGSVIWENSIANGGYGTLSLTKDKVIVHTNFSDITALNKLSGEKIWTFETSARVRASLTTNKKDEIYFTSGGNLYCLDNNGEKLWDIFIDGVYFYGRIDILGNLLYTLGTDTGEEGLSHIYIFCIDLSSTELLWRQDLGMSPIISSDTSGIGWGKDKAYVGLNDKIVSIDPYVGSVLKEKKITGNAGRQTLTSDDNYVYWTSTSGEVGASDVENLDDRWTYKANSYISTPVTILKDSVIFSADGYIVQLEKKTGLILKKLPAGHSPYSACSLSPQDSMIIGAGEPPYDGYLFSYKFEKNENDVDIFVETYLENNVRGVDGIKLTIEFFSKIDFDDAYIDIGSISSIKGMQKLNKIKDNIFATELSLRKNIINSEYMALIEATKGDKTYMLPTLIEIREGSSKLPVKASIPGIRFEFQEEENYSGAAISRSLVSYYGVEKSQKNIREMVDAVKSKSGYESFQTWRLILRRVLISPADNVKDMTEFKV